VSSWLDVEWSSGDTPTETKLDQMQENLDYLRDELEYRQLACSGWSYGSQGRRSGNDATWEWRVKIQGHSATSTARTFNSTEYAIDGLTALDVSGYQDDAIHVLDVEIQVRPSGGTWTNLDAAGRIYFLKTPEVDRLHVAGHATGIPQRSWTSTTTTEYLVVYVNNLHVAGHRNTGDSSWVSVDFVGATPGPAEIADEDDANGMLTNADIVRRAFNARAIGSECLFKTGVLAAQTSDDDRPFRLALRIGGLEFVTGSWVLGDGWVEHELLNLDVGVLPDWTLAKAVLIPQYQVSDVWYDSADGSLAEILFWNTPDTRYLSFAGYFKIKEGASPGWTFWSTYRTIWSLGFGLFATRETITR